MDSKQKCEHHQEDYLLMMYHRGMHYVCERIFLNLGLETIRSCQEASLQWRGMFNFYLSSDLIQIKKIISKWLALANNDKIFALTKLTTLIEAREDVDADVSDLKRLRRAIKKESPPTNDNMRVVSRLIRSKKILPQAAGLMAGAFFSGRHEGVVVALSANEVIASLRKCLRSSHKSLVFPALLLIGGCPGGSALNVRQFIKPLASLIAFYLDCPSKRISAAAWSVLHRFTSTEQLDVLAEVVEEVAPALVGLVSKAGDRKAKDLLDLFVAKHLFVFPQPVNENDGDDEEEDSDDEEEDNDDEEEDSDEEEEDSDEEEKNSDRDEEEENSDGDEEEDDSDEDEEEEPPTKKAKKLK